MFIDEDNYKTWNRKTGRPQNLRMANGTLALTTIYEQYLSKNFTSAKITSKKSFGYGRKSVRAAKPSGKMIFSQIMFRNS